MVGVIAALPKRFQTEGAIGGANGACSPRDRKYVTRPTYMIGAWAGAVAAGYPALSGVLDMVQDLP